MNKRIYTQQDRTDIFRDHIIKFEENNKLFKKGFNVFKPRVSYGTSIGSQNFSVYVEITYKIYNKDLKAISQENFNYNVPLILKGNGEYVIEDNSLNIHQNIIDFTPKSAIEKSIATVADTFGSSFGTMYNNNRKYSISKKAIEKFKI